jgi:hypothetical protein
MITKAQSNHKSSTKTRPIASHSHPNHLIKSGFQTACNCKLGYHDSCTLYKGSALYPWVVISSLCGRLEKPRFCHDYTSLGVWPRDHYMLLQRSNIGVCRALLWFSEQKVPACSAKVSRTNVPSCTMWFRQITKYVTKYDHKVWCHPHSTEHDTQPIAYLISKQAVPYRTHGGTCCSGVSTPKIRSLAYSSTTNHSTWRSPTVSTLPTLLKP